MRLQMESFVEYVRKGKIIIDGTPLPLPIATIGGIKTISSAEIESLRVIRRVTQLYLSDNTQTPLRIAVFGTPGSGKSFTVKNVFRTLTGPAKELIHESSIECNLSGLAGPEDISHVFQEARDLRLKGKVPVMFFDEFDCSVGESTFFWLKHFLARISHSG
jgi:SpoVK/Ycf46/Vps4 family AAA+-type ATPase